MTWNENEKHTQNPRAHAIQTVTCTLLKWHQRNVKYFAALIAMSCAPRVDLAGFLLFSVELYVYTYIYILNNIYDIWFIFVLDWLNRRDFIKMCVVTAKPNGKILGACDVMGSGEKKKPLKYKRVYERQSNNQTYLYTF